MSCFFCNSVYHFSQNCDIYISDKSRQTFLRSKRCCQFCLTPILHKKYQSCLLLENCKQNCYICLSKGEHHTVFCPDRFEASKLFLPNLNQIIFSRYFQMFNLLEQISMAFFLPNLSKCLSLKPLKAINNFIISSCKRKIKFFGDIFIKQITVTDSIISQADFFMLLSSKTNILICENSTITTNFSKLLEKLPNLEELQLFQTPIELGNSWIEDLMKHKNVTKFKRVSFEIKDFNFDATKLAKFMMSTKGVYVLLYLNNKSWGYFQIVKILKEKFAETFIPVNPRIWRNISVTWLKKCAIEKRGFMLYNILYTLHDFKHLLDIQIR